jgi:di/tricarboxylate transporter
MFPWNKTEQRLYKYFMLLLIMKRDERSKHFGRTLRNVIIGIGIFILTLFVVVYGISLFYPSVDYDNYCGKFYQITNEADCISEGGTWQAAELKSAEAVPNGFCSESRTCQDEYDSANMKRSKNVFIIAVPLGLILIALGAFVFHLNSVGVGIMFGGIGTLIYGAGNYWRYSDNLFKFIISLIGLAVLIFLAYWFNGKFNRKKK